MCMCISDDHYANVRFDRDQQMRRQLQQFDLIEYPQIELDPINEFQTPYLLTMSFPNLFPDGKFDYFQNPGQRHPLCKISFKSAYY